MSQQAAPIIYRGEKYLVGKEVTIYAPSGHIISLAYGAGKQERGDNTDDERAANDSATDNFGEFTCTLLSAEIDEEGQIVSGMVEYPVGRKYLRRDHLSLKGCAISHQLEREGYSKASVAETVAHA